MRRYNKFMFTSAMFKLFLIFLILISLPLVIVISIIITVSSGLPILFKQKRFGKNNKPFIMFKFRTMKIGAEKLQDKLRKFNESDGPTFKIHNDPRFTPIGKFLSHTGLDELPQLWNVLRGDMALIGPRPLPVNESRKLTKWQRKRHDIKPGIISPWILTGYHNKPFNEWMKSDIEYAEKKSLIYDCKIVFRMIPYFGKLFIREILSFYLNKARED